MTTTAERLNEAIKRLAATPQARAARLKINERQLRRWQKGTIPRVIVNLEACGLITINAPAQTDRSIPVTHDPAPAAV